MGRAWRISLWFLLLLGWTGAVYASWATATARAAAAEAKRDQVAQSRALREEVWALRHDVQVAAALGRDGSIAQSLETRLAGAHSALDTWRASEWNPRVALELERTLAAFDALDANITQARQFLRNDQRSLATEVTFVDGPEIAGAVLAHLDEVDRLLSEDAGRAPAVASVPPWAWVTMAGVVVLLALAGPAFRRDESREPVQRASAPKDARASGVLSLGNDPPTPPVETPQPAVTRPVEPPAPKPVERPDENRLDWPDVARMCTELARVNDAQELGAVLDRAIALLEARGLILWMWDPDEEHLKAVLARGYQPRTLGRLQPIGRDDANTAALAFRTGQLQVVEAEGSLLGVVVAPLLSAGGCIGVATVEMKAQRETWPEVHALTRILAAQLGTMVAGAPAREPSSSDAKSAASEIVG